MATSTIIQFLGNEAAGGTASTMNRSQVETFIAGGSITAGDFVILDTSQTGSDRALYVIQSPATAGNALVVGVAKTGATTGQKVDVVVAGYYATANVVTGVNAGEAITTSGATAGRCLKYLTGTHTNTDPIGVVLANAASNVAPVIIFKHF
jgi:hypothetical protein